jgi:two-component system chemotaxis sensor kinase CheA
VELTSAEPRSAIEDVFIFVMDDMKLEIVAAGAPAQAAEPAAPAPPEAVVSTPASTPQAGQPAPREERPAANDTHRPRGRC